MRIHLFTSSTTHPVYEYLVDWARRVAGTHDVLVTIDRNDLTGADALFMISAGEIIRADVRSRYRNTVVIHPSDLPRGRGWSPQVWAVVEGAREIVVTAIEAVDKVDAGPVWGKLRVPVEPHELVDEIHDKVFRAELALMDDVIAHLADRAPVPQPAEGASYYRKRTPEDSRVDPERSIAAQFDLLRICDPDRYPAFFDLHGHRYAIRLTKVEKKT